MAEEKQIALSISDYPTLEGIKPGEKMKIHADAEVIGDMEDGKKIVIQLENCDLDMENHADKAFKKMTEKEPESDYDSSADDEF